MAATPEPERPKYAANRINRLMGHLGATRYLEIGVWKGVTFLDVTAVQKIGVDPVFDFDVESVANERTVLVEATSDEFFAGLPVDRTFDFVFLDGLHTFEQTYRDLCNVLLHSHRRTVILIDDTLPTDPYSALPDQERSLRLRAQQKLPGTPWHGDVFRVALMIHGYHPALAYRTIRWAGNPQTLVWRGPRVAPEQPALPIDEIARMSWFDLIDRRELLLECSEDDAIAECLAALRA